MRGLNRVQLIGNLGKDPDMRYTPAGKAVTTFSLAVNQSRRNSDTGERSDSPEWFRVVAWDKLAEIANEHLHKGSRVYLDGRLQTRQWRAADGQEQRLIEVVISEFMMLDAPPARAAGPVGPADVLRTAAGDDADLPF